MNMLDELFKNDPTLQAMDPLKKEFILNFARQDKPRSMDAAMPFLISNLKIAKQQQINFSRPEVLLLTEILCRDLPPKEQERVKKMMAMLGNMNK